MHDPRHPIPGLRALALAAALLASCGDINTPPHAHREPAPAPEMRPQLAPPVWDPVWDAAFVGREHLSNPTDRSIDVSLIPRGPVEIEVDYGEEGIDRTAAPTTPVIPGRALRVRLDGLRPSAAHGYRVRWREPGATEWLQGQAAEFTTQRAPGVSYRFAIQTDSHLENMFLEDGRPALLATYRDCLELMAADRPDFVFSLGDFAMTELLRAKGTSKLADSLDEARRRYTRQRQEITNLTRAAPFFLAIGNHDGEQGWWRNGTTESLAAFSTRARNELVPGPDPGAFYRGSSVVTDEAGIRRAYYSFTWGDALFVVIDPYWNTLLKPHPNGPPKQSGDSWDWTLGKRQYDWLQRVLSSGSARFKFVLAHQITGGIDGYGRGGIEAARHSVAGNASYEWGGEDVNGRDVFRGRRPGWMHGPIHQILVDTGVDVFFHGHDHVYAHQVLDGVIYQACPQPSASLPFGHREKGAYVEGTILANSGYLRVSVSPTETRVEYVKASAGEVGSVAHAYAISAD